MALRREIVDAKLRAMLATAALPPAAPGLDDLRLAEPLASGDDELGKLDELFAATERAMNAVTEKLLPAPLLAARRVNLALDHVQAGATLTDVMRAVPSELCWAGDFDRVLFSRVEESSWVPATWYTTDPGSAATVAFGQLVHGSRFTLSNGSIEAEIVRRRVTALVTDAAEETRTFPPLLSVAECQSYIVAPVVSGEAVVGLLHADAAASGRRLAEADRVTLRAFADGVGLILERMALVEALAKQRHLIADALAAAERAVAAIADAPVSLAPRPPEPIATSHRAEEPLAHDGLTAREREVFALLVSGATNAAIADRLTVSETTVKSHVKHILRKMHVGNRAEAIAKYLRDGNNLGVSR
ncbi:LuxR C-terminal-related transcriptional regulator [Nocardioides immobilis]|uniref:LuxR C-terminal-related transcriptional regulator n=1 Tax=Nocardioides immobilis TaxID=2049295 RepID=UPI001C71544C|nr:LuxR C-terminal-related transcriptional regulator [Nocardioides immobilis]